jgi:hypothetical protein
MLQFHFKESAVLLVCEHSCMLKLHQIQHSSRVQSASRKLESKGFALCGVKSKASDEGDFPLKLRAFSSVSGHSGGFVEYLLCSFNFSYEMQSCWPSRQALYFSRVKANCKSVEWHNKRSISVTLADIKTT